MRFNRREFLKGILAIPVVGLPLSVVDRPLPPSGRDSPSSIRSARWVQTAADFQTGEKPGLAVLGGKEGHLALAGESRSGAYLSPPFSTSFPFNAVAAIWQADIPEGSVLDLALRTSKDGLNWSDWLPVVETADLLRRTDKRIGELITTRGNHIQWSARFRGSSTASPSLREVAVVYIDSSPGPRAADAWSTPLATVESPGVAAPTIILRAAWGCPEPYSSVNWPPAYQRVTKIVVHHTATSNDYPNGAEVVRAIWQYHAVELAWGDIGYNYLADRFGYIYEGRYGGDDVIGGHVGCYNPGSSGVAIIGNFETGGVSPPAQDALVRLMAWLAYRRDINPLIDSYFVDQVAGNICGHSDLTNDSQSCYSWTLCPGVNLHSLLPTLRNQTWSMFPQYADTWLGHNTPSSMGIGETATVNVSVVNKGRLTWPAGGSYPVRLGYHWYRSDGSQYVQDSSEDHRTPLPSDIAYNQGADLRALLTAPRASGTYTLKWDMVHELVTWFADRGVPTLNISVNVLPPVLSVNPAALYFLADSSTNPSPQLVTIQNAGHGTLRWSASSNQAWCKLSAASGTAPATIAVSVDKSAVPAGATYNATITISGSDGTTNSPQYVSVTFKNSATPLRKIFLPLAQKGASP